jgi:hypothetical protein
MNSNTYLFDTKRQQMIVNEAQAKRAIDEGSARMITHNQMVEFANTELSTERKRVKRIAKRKAVKAARKRNRA